MHGHLLAASSALALATLLGCASSNPTPDAPLVNAEPDPPSDGPRGADAASPQDMGGEGDPAPQKGAGSHKSPGDSNGSIPDDYMITNGDCDLLGKQLAAVTRSDEVAKLSPKLTEKQRSDAEKSFEDGSRKTGDKFAEGCRKSSAGSNGDPKALKCALNAKTAKEFDGCLNAPAPPKP